MNRYLIALCFACGLADAGTVFVLPNDVGGAIMLTDEKCEGHEDRKLSYIKTKESQVLGFGCWFYASDDESFVVIYGDGTVYAYPASGAKVTKYGEQQFAPANADPVL